MYLLNNIKFHNMLKNDSKNVNQCIWCKKYYNINKIKKGIDKYHFCSIKCQNNYNKNKFQTFKKNNRCSLHPFQQLTFRNECWGCYKDNFYNNMYDLISYYKIKQYLYLKLLGFKFYPTFRNSIDSWNGDKIAFEQNLKDHNVKWFVYIKFCEADCDKKINKNFINKNKDNFNKNLLKNYLSDHLCPLVCGKSGSLLVNNSGSDLNFSTNIKDGPARLYLSQTKRQWCYDLIAIKKVNSQRQAYELESKIIKSLKIFGS